MSIQAGSLRLALAASVLALALLAGCGGQPQEEIWIIGLDGADWDILEPMMARGDLPNLSRLRREGAWGRLRSDEPMLSPILWTSIATGKTADLHGVTWFMTDAPDGTKIPISSRNRQVRALWNIASERGVSVGLVGWWATWPAEPVEGWAISDYVAWHSFGVTGKELSVPGKTWPPELLEQITPLYPSPESVTPELLQTMVNLPEDRLGFDAAAGPFGGPIQHLRQAIATARGNTDVALRQLKKDRPRMLALYYEGTDAVKHLFMSYAPPQQEWVSDEDFAAFKGAVDGYWKWQDQLLGELLEQATEQTTIMLVSDHGFRRGNERLKEERFSIDTADDSHMPDGIVVLHGRGVAANKRIQNNADLYDVTPTVLRLLGLPVARDMVGRVLEEGLDATVLGPAVDTIATYETGDWDRGDELVVDSEMGETMEEMLASLGYISGGSEGTQGATGTGSTNVEQAVNLAVVLREQGRHEEAAKKLEDLLVDHPGHTEARSNLARVYGEMGRVVEAKALYEKLLEEAPDDIQRYDDLALAVALADGPEAALAVYEEGLKRDPRWARGLSGKGFALHQMGRSKDGLAAVAEALAADPRLGDAHYYRGMILLEMGLPKEALPALKRALELDPEHFQANVTLATRAIEEGLPEQAIPMLEIAVAQRPSHPKVLGNLGMAYAMTGRLEDAIQQFERVVELDPESAEARGQLGGLLAQAGRVQDAQRWLSEGVRLAPDNPMMQINLSMVYAQLGRLEDAEKACKAAIDLAPEQGVFVFQLASIYQAQGRGELAAATAERAFELDPTLRERMGGP